MTTKEGERRHGATKPAPTTYCNSNVIAAALYICIYGGIPFNILDICVHMFCWLYMHVWNNNNNNNDLRVYLNW